MVKRSENILRVEMGVNIIREFEKKIAGSLVRESINYWMNSEFNVDLFLMWIYSVGRVRGV